MKRLVLTGVFLSLVITLGVAQALTVEYADGTVQVQTTKGWKDLSVGSSVAADAKVRISDSGSVEFSRGAQRFSLLKDGVYALADVLKSSGRAGEAGVGVTLTRKLRNVAAGGQQSSTAVGGVRGAAQGDNSQNLTWMGDEEDDPSSKARALLDKDRFKEAEKEIVQALDKTQDEQRKQDLSYLLAAAYYGQGESARAYRALVLLKDDPGSTYHPDSVILKAQILLDNRAYADSLKVLKDFIAQKPDNSYAQVGYLLSAQCYKGLGDDKSAKAALDAGYALDPGSDTAKQIAKMQGKEL